LYHSHSNTNVLPSIIAKVVMLASAQKTRTAFFTLGACLSRNDVESLYKARAAGHEIFG